MAKRLSLFAPVSWLTVVANELLSLKTVIGSVFGELLAPYRP